MTIRGTDSAPDFGSGSVSAKTFTTDAAITEFQIPAATGGNGGITYAASGLPTSMRFDATGSDSPGCPGTEAREICGTPTATGSGTITATDADSNSMTTDRDTLSFTYTMGTADSAPDFGTGSVSNMTYIAGQAITEFQVPAATGGNGTINYAAFNLPTGLRFDATGSASPGCPGTEAREICGTPTTATDADTITQSSDRATLTFSVTVAADSAPSFGAGSVANMTFATGAAVAEFQVPAATGGNGTITYAASGLPTRPARTRPAVRAARRGRSAARRPPPLPAP